jgi:hypothetical protein
VVEWDGLENRLPTCRYQGSNPCLSAHEISAAYQFCFGALPGLPEHMRKNKIDASATSQQRFDVSLPFKGSRK